MSSRWTFRSWNDSPTKGKLCEIWIYLKKIQMPLKYFLMEDWTTKNCVLTIADRIRLRSLTVEWYSTGHFALYILFNTFFLSSLYYEKPIPTIALYLSKLICFYQDNWGWRNNNIFFFTRAIFSPRLSWYEWIAYVVLTIRRTNYWLCSKNPCGLQEGNLTNFKQYIENQGNC